jgi:flavin-dependent dehydrogenase
MFDALVIGAGPAGSTAARLLAQAGWRVGLVEKSVFPRRKVCGEFVSAATLPVLAACGIGEDFSALAGPDVTRVGFYARGAQLSSAMPRASGAAAWGRALGRERLDTLLRDAAVHAGARLLQPCKLVALRRTELGHDATIKTETGTEELSARIVVAASGSWELGPFAVEGADRRKPSDLFAFKAHFRNSALPPGLMPLLVFPGGYGGMVHSDGGRVSLSCCIRRDWLVRARAVHAGSAAEAVFEHIRIHAEGVRLALSRVQPDGAFLASGPIRPGIRRRYADGVFYAGNIAGEAHPIIAEGISMAIQSAWLLAGALMAEGRVPEGAALDAAGARYAAEWQERFTTRIRAAALFAHLAMRPRVSALGVPLVGRFPKILTWGARLSGKVNALPA